MKQKSNWRKIEFEQVIQLLQNRTIKDIRKEYLSFGEDLADIFILDNGKEVQQIEIAVLSRWCFIHGDRNDIEAESPAWLIKE